MITSRRHAAALTRTLEVKADQAMTADSVAAAPRFDPNGPPSTKPEATEPIDLFDDVLGWSPRRAAEERLPSGRRRLLLPAAALLVVVALVGAGAVAVSRGGESDGDVRIVSLGDPPEGWLVPTWMPEGMDLWGVDSSGSQGLERDAIAQLFGDPDAGRAIYVTSSRYEVRPDTAEQVSVRGQAGKAGRGWDVEESDVGDAIGWEERGVAIVALFKGVTRAEAVAALDSLEWRSDDPADGFAPPSEGSLPLRAEVSSRQSVDRDVILLYSDGVPDLATGERLGLWVHTSSSTAISIGYLEGWYLQGSEAGGGERPLSSYDPDRHELRVVWPDGRSIDISPVGGTPSQPLSRAVLEDIADSLTVGTEADLAAMRDAVGAGVEALPVVASAATSIGTVDVRGEGDFLRLCRRGPGDDGPSCVTDMRGGGSANGTTVVSGEWTVDGTWYVAVASKGDVPQIVGGRDRSSLPDAGELPAETTTVGDWTIRLVQPAPDIELVCTTSGGSISCNNHRPN